MVAVVELVLQPKVLQEYTSADNMVVLDSFTVITPVAEGSSWMMPEEKGDKPHRVPESHQQ